jgi:hypothetical protein
MKYENKGFHVFNGSSMKRCVITINNGVQVTIAKYIDQILDTSIKIEDHKRNKHFNLCLDDYLLKEVFECFKKFYSEKE